MTRAISAFSSFAALSAILTACGGGNPPKPPPVETPDAGAVVAAGDAGALVAAGDAGAAAPVSDPSWLILVDLDAIPPMAPVAKPETFAKQIGSTFKTFRKTKKECTGKGDALVEVDGGYEGVFATAGAKGEMLYLVNITPCDEKLPPTHNLIVTQGTKVKVNQAIPENDIISVKDLDLDGDMEIFVLSVTNGSVKARLVDTEDGKFEQLNDFGEVANGSCDNGKATGTSALIKYKKTETGIGYKVESKPKSCPPAK
jgi:hypothetical protein